jgi:cell division protein FtsW
MKSNSIDKPLLISILLLSFGGFFVFTSASLGLLANESGAQFSSIAINQSISLVIGLCLCLFVAFKINYKILKKSAFYFLFFAIILNLLVFVPKIGMTHGGATRWIDLGIITFQPSEILQLAFIIYFATWLSAVKERVRTFKFGLLPFLVLLSITGSILLLQKDTDTFIVICTSGVAMFMVAGARFKDIILLGLIGIMAFGVLAYNRPYIQTRLKTFINPSLDETGAGYQINQSLIAVGSGQITGRGFGQSVQKFDYLPEPIGDSIFAVASEEFGFMGGVIIILLFMIFSLRALKIASLAPDMFGGLLVVGIVILIITESFMNISSMLGIIPLSGQPLLFISHGGTALIITLFMSGIILNISKYAK